MVRIVRGVQSWVDEVREKWETTDFRLKNNEEYDGVVGLVWSDWDADSGVLQVVRGKGIRVKEWEWVEMKVWE